MLIAKRKTKTKTIKYKFNRSKHNLIKKINMEV